MPSRAAWLQVLTTASARDLRAAGAKERAKGVEPLGPLEQNQDCYAQPRSSGTAPGAAILRSVSISMAVSR